MFCGMQTRVQNNSNYILDEINVAHLSPLTSPPKSAGTTGTYFLLYPMPMMKTIKTDNGSTSVGYIRVSGCENFSTLLLRPTLTVFRWYSTDKITAFMSKRT